MLSLPVSPYIGNGIRLRSPEVDGPAGSVVKSDGNGQLYIEILTTHDAVTLAGQDYLTINSNQVITAAQINLTTHVTGVLPKANMSSLSSGDISGLGTMATQNANAVNITGGSITGMSSPVNPSDVATKNYVDVSVTGLLDLKTAMDCSSNPNYPTASKGDSYYVSVAGKIGGASGTDVNAGDMFFAVADNAGGTQAAVGSSWNIIEHNLPTLGTAAFVNTGTSGGTVPLLNGANTWSAQNTFAAGTIATSQPFTVSQTWNNAAISFTASQIDVSGTPTTNFVNTSPNPSLYVNYRLNSTSEFYVRVGGHVVCTGNMQCGGSVTLANNGSVAFGTRGSLTSDSSSNIVTSGGLTVTGTVLAGIGGYTFASGYGLAMPFAGGLVLTHGSGSSNAGILITNGSGNLISKLYSIANNQLQLGGRDETSPVAQTLSVQSVLAGTSNTSAVDWTEIVSQSTGTGVAGNRVYKQGFSGVIQTAATVAISNASPAVITLASHGFVPGQALTFATSGSLPTGLTVGTTYYVIATGLATSSFRVSATLGGSAVNTSSAGSGTHTLTTLGTTQNGGVTAITYGPSGLTGSQTTPLIDCLQVWNTSGVATGYRFAVTGINMSGSSKIFDVQYNATSVIYCNSTQASFGHSAYNILTNGASCTYAASSNNNPNVHTFASGNQTQSNGSDHTDWRHTMTVAPTSGASKFYGMSLEHTVNQTSTASGDYTGMRVNLTKTAFLGTNSRLFEGQLAGVAKFEVFDNGNIVTAGKIIVTNSQTPSSASDTGAVGTIAWDTSFLYVCTATNTWKRAAITTW